MRIKMPCYCCAGCRNPNITQLVRTLYFSTPVWYCSAVRAYLITFLDSAPEARSTESVLVVRQLYGPLSSSIYLYFIHFQVF